MYIVLYSSNLLDFLKRKNVEKWNTNYANTDEFLGYFITQNYQYIRLNKLYAHIISVIFINYSVERK